MLVHGSPRTLHHFYLIVIRSRLVRWYYKAGPVSNEAPAEGACGANATSGAL
jgi:hypothetical protein